jgi:hypothetical protein
LILLGTWHLRLGNSGDLQHQRAITLSARPLDDRSDHPQGPLRVYADPAGHPFCIFVADSAAD